MRSKDKSCLPKASGAGGSVTITRDLDKRIVEILNSPFGGAAKAAKGKEKKRAKRTARKGSWNEARQLHRRLMFRLKKYGSSEAEKVLLRILKDCKRSRLCGSAACPRCTYKAQGVMAALITEQRSYGIKMESCLTIIPLLRIEATDDVEQDLVAAKGKVERFRRQLDEAFEESEISTVIGAVDFTCNEYPGGEHGEHSKPHLHALVFGNQLKSGEKILRSKFPRKGSVHKPVDIRAYDGCAAWPRYIFKYPEKRGIRKKGENGNWKDVSYKALKVQQQMRQALLLHEMGWEGRLYLRGVDLIRGAHGWQLVLSDLMPQVRIRGGKRN